ncbi:MAG: alanine racemase [Candidatus Cloacimonadota bacterium]|nr:MAG: alanine racemase [Candidatus Cloacimonadota bacterium]
MTISRVNLYVDLKKIQENFREISKKCSPCSIMPILKANAYGLGVVEITNALVQVGAKYFGVADLNEANQICKKVDKVLLLGEMLPQELCLFNDNIVPSICSLKSAFAFNKLAKFNNSIIKVHLLIDSGMGRLGIPIENAFNEILKIKDLKNLKLEGIFSHLSSANCDENYSLKQIQTFNALILKLKNNSLTFNIYHIANSDGINNIKISYKAPFNLVRSGINLFGVFDQLGKKDLNLQSVLKLTSKLVSKRFLKKGSAIGYSQSYILSEDTWVGTVPIGYADGVPQNLSNQAFFYKDEFSYKVIGKISMDYTTIDLGKTDSISVGDEITVLKGTEDIIKWAEIKGTIPYDIICSIGNRVKRVYL